MSAIANIQSGRDLRNLPTNQVGIKDLRLPISLKSEEGKQSTVARPTMTAFPLVDREDARMPRLVVLMEKQTDALDFDTLHKLIADVVALLDSHFDKISVSFPFSRKGSAPVSGIRSLPDYGVTLIGETKNGIYSHSLRAMVPVTSSCPYSKEISQYGAHGQHSHVTVSLIASVDVSIEGIIDYAEVQASCQLYGSLRRPNKKYIAEKAYENSKFVEDMVRDMATVLIADKRIEPFVVEGENFELIYNHFVYAYIAYP